MSWILGTASALARLATAIVFLWWALDWRSPFLASIRWWAFAGLVLVPLGVIVIEIHSLRRGYRRRRSLNVISLLFSVLCLSSVLWLELRFQWIRFSVLSADAAQLEKLGHHVVVGYRDRAELDG